MTDAHVPTRPRRRIADRFEVAPADRIRATNRSETEECERSTPSCSIDHHAESRVHGHGDTPCDTW